MVRIRITSYTRARHKTQDYAHKELGLGVNRPSFEQHGRFAYLVFNSPVKKYNECIASVERFDVVWNTTPVLQFSYSGYYNSSDAVK